MMNFIRITLICLLFVTEVQAQPEKSTPQMQQPKDGISSPPYKLAIGVRMLNFAGDFDLGVNGKYFLNRSSALEASLSKVVFNNGAYQLALMYERHSSLFNSKHLLVYYGGGASLLHIIKAGYGNYYTESKASTQPGIGFIVGVEVGLGKIPLAFSADFRSLYYKEGDRGLPNVANGTLGLKYRFGMRR